MNKFYGYCPNDGYHTFETEEKAQEYAQDAIDGFRDYADDGWDENVDQISWGEIKQHTVKTADLSIEEAEKEGIIISGSFSGYWDFGLKNINEEGK